MSQNNQSLSLVNIRCHSLSFFVTLSFVVTRCLQLYHSLSLVVSLIVIHCHSLSLVVTRCITHCYSLSLVVTRCTTHCHSLVLVVTRCIIHLSFYKQSSIFHDLRTLKIQFLEHTWIYLSTFDLVEKIFSWIFWGRKNADLIEELATKIMSSGFLKSTFGLTQTRKSCNGRMKFHEL